METDSPNSRYPAWRYIVFVVTNVLLMFAAFHAVGAAMAYPAVPPHWADAMLFSVVFNAVALPIHIRRFGPVWRTPPYGPAYRLWRFATRWRRVQKNLMEGSRTL